MSFAASAASPGLRRSQYAGSTMTTAVPVHVFFYGTFMLAEVLAKHGVTAGPVIPARVTGFELSIRPRVNLIRKSDAWAFGSVVAVSHEDLNVLYGDLAERLGLTYRPETVVAITETGALLPALCYIAPAMSAAAADPSYVAQLADCVRSLGHPEWYARHVESFSSAEPEREP